MNDTKNLSGEVHQFHYENFKRRSRYVAVFVVLAILFFVTIIWNINTGTVNIPVSCDSGRSIVSVRIPSSDFF